MDRVFTLAGHGTVVTGTVFSGQVRAGDAVVVMPAEMPVRVRSIHAQNRASDTRRAGQRCALNLVGRREERDLARRLARRSARARADTRVDARLRLLADSDAAARDVVAHCTSISARRTASRTWSCWSRNACPAGESARVQLVFDTPVCAMPGDRFIVRDAQAAHTIGGGVVLDPSAPSRRRRSAERLRYLDALEEVIAGEGMSAAAAERASRREHDRSGATDRSRQRVPLPPTPS